MNISVKPPSRKLPSNLRWMPALAIVGMFIVSSVSGPLSVSIEREWPNLSDHLWTVTPSLRHLQLVNANIDEQHRVTSSQIVTVLYGMYLWSGLCIVVSVVWSLMTVPKITFADGPGLEKWRIVGLLIFIVLLGVAAVFFGLYPLRSETFLVRGGLLNSAAFWWLRALLLIASCTVGVMLVIYSIATVMKMQRREVGSE